jgi:hypothetical protein
MASTFQVNQTDNNLPWEILIFGSVIVILLILAIWLLKNSNRLEGTIDHSETSCKTWLKNHLKDLDHHQLDILIRHYSLSDSEPLQDTKPQP